MINHAAVQQKIEWKDNIYEQGNNKKFLSKQNMPSLFLNSGPIPLTLEKTKHIAKIINKT